MLACCSPAPRLLLACCSLSRPARRLADLYTETIDPAEYETFLLDLLQELKSIGRLGQKLIKPPDLPSAPDASERSPDTVTTSFSPRSPPAPPSERASPAFDQSFSHRLETANTYNEQRRSSLSVLERADEQDSEVTLEPPLPPSPPPLLPVSPTKSPLPPANGLRRGRSRSSELLPVQSLLRASISARAPAALAPELRPPALLTPRTPMLVGPRRPRSRSAEHLALPSLNRTPPFSRKQSGAPSRAPQLSPTISPMFVLSEGRAELSRLDASPPLSALGEIGALSPAFPSGTRMVGRSRSLDHLMTVNGLNAGARPLLLQEAARVRQAHSRVELGLASDPVDRKKWQTNLYGQVKLN